MKELGFKIHEKGFNLRIKSATGDYTCGEPQRGLLSFHKWVLVKFKEWGLDYLQYLDCGSRGLVSFEERVVTMAERDT